jgi:hypothetical protein
VQREEGQDTSTRWRGRGRQGTWAAEATSRSELRVVTFGGRRPEGLWRRDTHKTTALEAQMLLPMQRPKERE